MSRSRCRRRSGAPSTWFAPGWKSWIGERSTGGDSRLLRSIRVQGQVCSGMGSSMYGDLLARVADNVEADGVFATILAGHENASGRMALALRLLGGLHRLALDGRAAALRQWYPSTGGRWNADAAWPDIVSGRHRARRLSARRARPAAADQRGRPVRRADRRPAAASRRRFDVTGAAFRNRLQRRAEPARRPLPLPPSRRRLGSGRLTGDRRRRMAGPAACPRRNCRSSNVRASTSRRWTPPAPTAS